MKACEIRGGRIDTLELGPTTGAFDPLVEPRSEVFLHSIGGEILLVQGDRNTPVQVMDTRRQETLVEIVESRLPCVCWVASSKRDRLTIQVHRFTADLTIPGVLPIGVDEAIQEDLRIRHKVGGTVAEMANWLADRLLLGPSAGTDQTFRRAIFSAGRDTTTDAFRLIGRGIAIDVLRHDEGLRVIRILKGGGMDESLRLLEAPLLFIDESVAGKFATGVRAALEDAVRSSGSYLKIWQTYNDIERDTVLRRRKRVGAIQYSKCERRRDGGFSFYVKNTDEIRDYKSAIEDNDRMELEAGKEPPDFEELDDKRRHEDRLTAAVTRVDIDAGIIMLRAPEDEEEQPRPPEEGFLYLSITGSRSMLRRRENAEQSLRTGTCHMPQVALLIEDRPAPRSGYKARTALSRAVLKAFGGKPTQRQIEALEAALNTPDVALIQGPPGTGKTRVIAALEQRLAELAEEGTEVNHRILVTSTQHDAVENVAQRTEVFGLPAVKVDKRRGQNETTIDGTERFGAEHVEGLRAKLREPPEAERMARALRIAQVLLRAPAPKPKVATTLRELHATASMLLPPNLADEILGHANTLLRGQTGENAAERDLYLLAARGIRVDAIAFEDDGPVKAKKALLRLTPILRDTERVFLQRCAAWVEDKGPLWLEEGQALKDAIIDRLSTPPPPPQPTMDDETQKLLVRVVDAIERKRATSIQGVDAVLATYLDDLENDPEALRDAIQHYTAVLAATCQGAASKAMRVVRGIDVGSVAFESVIVDEAARSNPLDLFIPLSMAKRRVVLVGDHRQLPHMLEPDVETELGDAVKRGEIAEEAVEALKKSLFEKLWHTLKRLQSEDGIPRTVTLDMQFRMHPVLGDFISRVFYESKEDGKIESGGKAEHYAHDLHRYIKDGRSRVAAWFDVPGGKGRWERGGRSKARRLEAVVIGKEIRRLIDVDDTLSFGVIAFYSDQVEEIRDALVKEGIGYRTNGGGFGIVEQYRRTKNRKGELVERLRVGTVDAFQGKEFDVVFLSITRSNDLPGTDEERRRKYGHLMLDNRMCVAMSRQHRLLVAVGDRAFARAAQGLLPLQEFLNLCEGSDGIVLS